MLRISVWDRIPDTGKRAGIQFDDLRKSLESILAAKELRDEIEHLKNAGFVVQDRSGAFERLNGWFPLQRKLVAVELKLVRVKDAIRQAVRYQRYADDSYVALPYDRAIRSINRVQVVAHGLGLLGVGRNSVRVIAHPKPELRRFPVDRLAQAHAVERMWQTARSETV